MWVCLTALVFLLGVQGWPSTGYADRLVLISPHWEGIKFEFEEAFKTNYQRKTGREVELEWIDVGGT